MIKCFYTVVPVSPLGESEVKLGAAEAKWSRYKQHHIQLKYRMFRWFVKLNAVNKDRHMAASSVWGL